ncbi:MAG: peptide ligase PGM1-related protein [Nostoc sp.]|uniref:peptide ligase PGM1-related protein n=1 Tax=Nostoc sp. TaxID=1180 RepID=UPI002FF84C68
MKSLDNSFSSESEQFRILQTRLPHHGLELEDFGDEEIDILVVPSISLNQEDAQTILGIQHWEERLLPYLALLKYPNIRLVYVTSQPLHPALVDYYLHILLGVTFSNSDISDRLIFFSTYDSSFNPLSSKIIERPRLIQQIRQVLKLEKSLMLCYVSTSLERELSIKLQVPLFSLDPDLQYWGTKGGSQQIFRECGISHPDGSQVVWNIKDLATVAAELWNRHPNLTRMMIKLNEGIGGLGSAILDLTKVQHLASKDTKQVEKVEAIYSQFDSVTFQNKSENWANFINRIQEQGAIIEIYIDGNEKRSPSVQGVITPDGEVKIISTHEQILGGSDSLLFQGCTFPADVAYQLEIREYGLKIGKNLAQKGVIGNFSIDFLAVLQSDEIGTSCWNCHAVEINLRKGGTSHPFLLLKFLTNGYHDINTGLFYSRKGLPKYYITSEQIHERNSYRGLLPDQLIDIMTVQKLHFNSNTETGTVFHMMGALSEFGKIGITSIGNSSQEAKNHFDRVMKALEEI